MYIKAFLRGFSTYVPGLRKRFSNGRTGGTDSARYCYSVWLRHLIYARKNSLPTQPHSIAELGPGDSLGIGLAAMLTGTTKYYAFDVVEYSNNERNIEVFNELVELFKKRQKIPNDSEFPDVRPYLESYEFPNHILTDERLDRALNKDRIEFIKNALTHLNTKSDENIPISYIAPWDYSDIIKDGSIDMIYSQAVMEHIDDLPRVYKLLYRWLKPGGVISNQIDFRCHGMAREWNGHWAYSDLRWKLIKGRSTYLLNREPCSSHINIMLQCGFKVVCQIRFKEAFGIKRRRLAKQFRNISDDDLTTKGAFFQAVKSGN